MNATVEISLVTPEPAPLARFGAGISEELSRLLADAQIAFHGASFAQLEHGRLTLRPSGLQLRSDRVVTLPVLEGRQIAGVPADPHGFIPVTEYGQVRGLDGVYAAGDITSYPVKHGGISAQQADVVAAAIARRAGAEADLRPLRPSFRGALMHRRGDALSRSRARRRRRLRVDGQRRVSVGVLGEDRRAASRPVPGAWRQLRRALLKRRRRDQPLESVR